MKTETYQSVLRAAREWAVNQPKKEPQVVVDVSDYGRRDLDKMPAGSGGGGGCKGFVDNGK